MKYIECPNVLENEETLKSLFVAGGITNCPNWQKQFAELLKNEDVAFLNPKRENFPNIGENLEVTKEQIAWEYKHIKVADAISFWFTDATIQPITLFELGKACIAKKNLFVGVDPNYERREDVEIQLGLERPNVKVVYSLEDLAEQVRCWLK